MSALNRSNHLPWRGRAASKQLNMFPGAARNDGMPSQRVAYAEAVRAIQAPSPTAPKDSQWEEEGPLEGAPQPGSRSDPYRPRRGFPQTHLQRLKV